MRQSKEAAYGCKIWGTIQFNFTNICWVSTQCQALCWISVPHEGGLFVFQGWSHTDGFHGGGERWIRARTQISSCLFSNHHYKHSWKVTIYWGQIIYQGLCDTKNCICRWMFVSIISKLTIPQQRQLFFPPIFRMRKPSHRELRSHDQGHPGIKCGPDFENIIFWLESRQALYYNLR